MYATNYEAERLYAQSYLGKKARLCLANNTQGIPLSSQTTAWDNIELSGNGYARVEWTLGAGTYNNTATRFDAPLKLANFQASGNSLIWTTAYLVIGTISNNTVTWEQYPSFLLNENVTLASGNSRAYNVQLFTDGLT